LRDPLCLRVRSRKQRIGVRGPERQHLLVQRHARSGHVLRPFLHADPDPRDRRFAGGQEESPGVGGDLSGGWPPFRAPARRRHRDRRCLDLLSRVLAGARRRAPVDERGNSLLTMARTERQNLFQARLVRVAARDSFAKLTPRVQLRNPVMFVVYVGAILVTLLLVRDAVAGGELAFNLQIAVWLWFTLLFANFAEAMAEGRGKAQAAALKRGQTETTARRLTRRGEESVPATSLRKGDRVVVTAGEVIPGDGTVVEGIASVDESAITGESAPVIRESGGDRSAVTGGTRVLSDRIVVEITSNPGETFLDRMIALVEGATRQKTP